MRKKNLEPESLLRRSLCDKCGGFRILEKRCEACDQKRNERRAARGAKRKAGLFPWVHRPIAAAYWQCMELYSGWTKERRVSYERKILLIIAVELRNCFLRMPDYQYIQRGNTQERLERVLGAIDILLLGWAGKSLRHLEPTAKGMPEVEALVIGHLGRTWETSQKDVATIHAQL